MASERRCWECCWECATEDVCLAVEVCYASNAGYPKATVESTPAATPDKAFERWLVEDELIEKDFIECSLNEPTIVFIRRAFNAGFEAGRGAVQEQESQK